MKLNKVGRASSPPRGFDREAYQKRINDTVGTKDGRPIIKLAWAPEERRWMPHRMEDDPPGYIFPIFCHGKNADGELTAPNCWVLLERIEPPQFGPTWEVGRYSRYDGSMWDWKGPLPSEKYVELRAYGYHDGECCTCIGDLCECGAKYAHCWGKYVEPDEHLMNWIRKVAWESKHDPDVKPDADIRYFESTQAQSQLRSSMLSAQEKDKVDFDEFNRHFVDHWEKQPSSILVSRANTLDAAYERSKALGYGIVKPNLRPLILPD